MKRDPLIIKSDNYQPALKVVGTNVTVLASEYDTKGQEFTFQSGDKGMGPPPHSHDWDEAFFVTKGSVIITTGGKTEECMPGTLAFVPGGTIHSFKYGSEGGEMLEITSVGGAAVKMFTELSKEIPAGSPDVKKIVAVMSRNGATVHI